MIVKIKSQELVAEIETFAAEIKSIKNNDGTEFMAKMGSKPESRTAPIAFPICGLLGDDKYIYKDKEYTLQIHGFAKKMEFELEEKSEDEATFLLVANDETRQCYPFEFEFRVNYKLVKNTIYVRYTARNADSDEMFFAFGGHEGYAIPEGLTEYKVVFDQKLTLDGYDVSGTKVREVNRGIVKDSETLNFDETSFRDERAGALVLPDIKSKECSIVHKNGTRKVTVRYDDFKHLLIWQNADEKYLCIEPWTMISDVPHMVGRIDEKPDMIRLEKGEEYSAVHSMTFSI